MSRGLTCDIFYHFDSEKKVHLSGEGRLFIQIVDYNSGDNIRSGWWDGTRNHGLEFVRPLLVGHSKQKDLVMTSQLQSTKSSPTMENRIGIILTWLTRVKDPI